MEKIKIVKFYAEWCGPCQVLKPVIDEIVKETGVELEEIDIDKNQTTALEKTIMSIPTVLIYKDGNEVFRKSGIASKEEYLSFILN